MRRFSILFLMLIAILAAVLVTVPAWRQSASEVHTSATLTPAENPASYADPPPASASLVHYDCTDCGTILSSIDDFDIEHDGHDTVSHARHTGHCTSGICLNLVLDNGHEGLGSRAENVRAV